MKIIILLIKYFIKLLESGDSDTLITEAFDGFIDKIKSILKKKFLNLLKDYGIDLLLH